MRASIGLAVFVLAGVPALAQPPQDLQPAQAVAAVEPAELLAPEVASTNKPAEVLQPPADNTLSMEELSDLRGGEAIVFQHTTQALTATNTGNSVNGDTIGSGTVNLGSNAFTGYDGIGNFVINTGHNNNLQGSISVSIAMTPQ